MPSVTFEKGIFICKTDFKSRSVPKEAGFKFDQGAKTWFTESAVTAAKLRDYMDKKTKQRINRYLIQRSPWLGPLPYPSHLTPKPFQLEAAKYALSQNKSYLGLDPGLGKTIVAAIIMNALHRPTVFICPPFLALNTRAELSKWCTWKPSICIFDPGWPQILFPDIYVIPDSLIIRSEARATIKQFIRYYRSVHLKPVLIVDEAHRYKNLGAQRTASLFGGEDAQGIETLFTRQIYLSGTPMPNRPMELYPILSKVAPETIDGMSEEEYGMKYCAGFFDGHGYDFKGASNLKELRNRVIGPFMLRMRKKDVLKELPPKLEELVVIGERPAKIIQMESALLRKASPEDLMQGKVSSDHISTYRKELGAFKVKPALDFISSLLDDSEESLLVFAYHTEVIEKLAHGLKFHRPFVITGKTEKAERQKYVEAFQKNPHRRLFILNYLAGGLGLTLTKATRVISVEFSWVPSENEQASDRAHRIGQTEPVLHQYLIYENSIDKEVMEVNFRKKKITEQL